MRTFNLIKSLSTRVINNYKGLLILCLSLATFGVESAWAGGGSKTYYAYAEINIGTGKGKIYQDNTLKAEGGPNTSVVQATGSSSSSSSSATVTVNLRAEAASGYQFSKWSGNNTTSNATISPSSSSSNTNKPGTKIGTYTANFTANTYTVTFDKNGGTTDANPKTRLVTFDANYTNFPTTNPTYTGYSFNGWWTEKTSGTQVTSNTKVSTASDHSLYAHWTANTNTPYAVKHCRQALDGSYPTDLTEIESKTGTTDTKVTPDRKSYDGFDAPAGTQITITGDGNASVTYQYTRKSYTLAWAGIDGATLSGSYTPAGSVKYGASLFAPMVSKTGYTFKGWSPEVPSTMPASNATYTAQWTANEYNISYYDQGGGNFSGTHESGYPTKHTYNTPTNLKGATKTGYTFGGWYKESDCSGSAVTTIGATAYTADIKLYAKWTPATYNVTLNTDGGTINSGDVTHYTYGVGATLPTDVTKTGYKFEGWFLNNTGNAVTKIGTTETGNKSYTAHWTEKSFTVTISAGANGSVEPSGSQTVKWFTGTSITATADPGYHFVNWTTTGGASVASTTDATTTVSATGTGSVTATFAPNTYTIAFDGNGNTGGSTSSITATYDQSSNLPTNGFTKTGYTFAGWKLNNTGDIQNPGTSVKNLASDQGAKVTYYAQWTANTYTLTFNPMEGGSVSPTSKSVTYDAAIGTLPTPTREGYEFVNWAVNGNPINESTIYKIADDATAYAQWKPKFNFKATAVAGTTGGNAYVSFAEAGETSKTTDQKTITKNVGETSATATAYFNAVANAGSSFVAWYTSENLSGESHYSDNAATTFEIQNNTVGSTASQTLYAKFATLNTFYATAAVQAVPAKAEVGQVAVTTSTDEAVNYVNGDQTGISKTSVSTTSTYAVVYPTYHAKNLTNGGYEFAGWYNNDGCEGEPVSKELAYYNSDGIETTTKSEHDNPDQTFYAKFNPKTFTIAFNANGGSADGSAKIVYKTNVLTNQTGLPITRAGWTLKGYYTSTTNDEMIVTAAGQLVKSTTLTDADGNWTSPNDATLYAQWTATSNSITLDANGGSQDGSATVMSGQKQMTISTEPVRAGYTVGGYLNAAAGTQVADAAGLLTTAWAGGDGILYAKWNPNTYDIALNPDVEGATAGSAKVQSGAKEVTDFSGVATRTGWTLQGYFTSEGTLLLTNEGALTAGVADYTDAEGKWIRYQNTELVAHWTATEYEVALNANGGTSSTNKVTGLRYGMSMPTGVNPPTRTGYTFLGYYDAQTGGTQYYTNTMASAKNWDKDNNTSTLWAHWQANTYTITFNGNGGVVSGSDSKSVTYDDTYGDLPTATRTGYTFDGWYDAITGGTKIESTTQVQITANKNLYAHWTAKTTTITFAKNNGTGGTNSVIATYDQPMPSAEAPTRDDYTFDGYMDANGKYYYDGDMNSICNWDQDVATITLTAQWVSQSTFSTEITLYGYQNKGNGTGKVGGIKITSRLFYYNEKFTIVSLPSRTGYSVDYFVTDDGKTKVADINGNFEANVGDYTGSAIIVGGSKHWQGNHDGIYAHWKANSYSVILNHQNGTQATTITATYGSNMPVDGVSVPSMTGYDFDGYYAEPYGEGTHYYTCVAGILSSGHIWDQAKDNSTLYGSWTAKTTTVTLSSEGATTHGTPSVTATYDAAMPTATAPTRTGYNFQGYFDATSEGNQYYTSGMASAQVWNKVDASTTLYAQWSAKTYSVTLDKKGGTGGTSSISPTFDAAMPTATAPSRTGYTFQGYYAQENGQGQQYYSNKMASMRTWDIADNATLYAYWKAKEYNVTLNPENGESAITFNAEYGQPMPAGKSKPNKIGYTFLGYYDGIENTAIQYYDANMGSVHNMDKSEEVNNFYAHWKANNYVVEYAAGDAAATGSTASQNFTYDVAQAVRSNGFALNYTITYMNLGSKHTEGVASKTFQNWKNLSNGNTYTAGQEYSNLAEAGTVTLTAQWSEKTEAINLAAAPTRTGYTFQGWWTAAEDGEQVTSPAQFTGATTLYAHWQANTYTITFDANGGEYTGDATVDVTYNTIYQYPANYEDPTKEGKSFEGWFTAATGGNKIEFGSTIYLTADNQTVFAHWAEPMSVKLANPDGTENGSANVTTTASALTIVLAPQQTGYTVEGYYTTTALNTKVAEAQVNGKAALVKGVTDWTDNVKGRWIAGDGKTIYIKWTPNTYDVTINPDNGGDNISAKVTYNDNKLTDFVAPTKTGYELKGYFTETSTQIADKDGKLVNGSSYVSKNKWVYDGGISLIAHWEAKSYTLTLDANSHGTDGSITIYYNKEKADAITKVTSTTHTLVGYFTDATNGSLVMDAEGNLVRGTVSGYVTEGKWTGTNKTKLYAQWYNNVTLNKGTNGTADGKAIVLKGDSKLQILEAAKGPEGFALRGYYNNNNNTGSILVVKADGSFNANNITNYVQNGKWIADDGAQLYAKWSNQNKCTITYYYENGTGGSKQETVVQESTMPAITIPTMVGYDFEGYYTEKEGKGTRYYNADGSVYNNRTSPSSSTLNLYANWTPSKFTVSFDGNGGTSPASKQVTYNQTYGTLPTATRTGYELAGWFTDATGGDQITAGTTVSITTNQTLYAHWTAKTYTVNLNYNNETTDKDIITATYAANLPSTKQGGAALSAPSYDGYTFKGYYDAQTDGKQYYSNALVGMAWDKDGANSYDLYAQWNENQYAVSFEAGTGTGTAMQDLGFTYTESQALRKNTYKKEVKVTFNADGGIPAPTEQTVALQFDKWQNKDDASKTYTDQQTVSKLTTVPNGKVTLVAQWKASATGITLPGEGEITRSGYLFKGWYEDNVETGKQVSGTYYATRTVTLVAKWELGKFDLTFKANGGEFSEGITEVVVRDEVFDSPYKFPDVEPTRTGYTFNGWWTSAAEGEGIEIKSGDIIKNNYTTLYAHWTANTDTKYTVKHYKQNIEDDEYTLAETENLQGTTATEVTPNVKTYEGFTAPATQTVTIAADESTVVTYYYTRNAYALTWDFAGGAATSEDYTKEGNIKFGATIIAPTLKKEGYAFASWSPEQPTTMPATAKTYTATWTANTYYVTFNGNGETSGEMDQQTLTYDETTLTLNTYERAYEVSFNAHEGSAAAPQTATYTFVNWNTQADGKGVAYANGAKNITAENGAEVQLFAQWESASITLPSSSRDGYDFEGWYDAETEGNKIGNAGETYTPTEDIALHAHWTVHQSTLTWNTDGDELTGDYTKGKVAFGTAIVAPNTPTKTGYNFAGWSDGTAVVTPATIMPDYDLTYTATWTAKPDTKYKENYLTEDLNGTTYTLYDSKEREGVTGATIVPTFIEIIGFTKPASTESVTIAADGSTVVEYKYSRNTYTLVWATDGGTITSEGGTYTAAGQVKYEEPIVAPTVTKTGYTHTGWYPSITSETKMPIGGVTFTATWTPNTDTKYTVKHYKQTLEGDYSDTPDDTDELEGETGASVTPNVKTYEGFTAPEKQTVTIAADGSTVVEYQYTRNAYALTWDFAGASATSEDYTKAGDIKFGATIIAPTLKKEGYAFASWSPEQPTTMPASEAIYTAQWAAVEVTGVTTPATLNFTTTGTQDATIEFTVTDGAKAEDFTYSVENNVGGDAWSFKSISVVGTKATIIASYSATLETTKGDHMATVILTSKGNTASTKSTIATANVNYTLTKVEWEGATTFGAAVEPFVPTFKAYFYEQDVTEQVSPMTYTLLPEGQTVAKIEDGKIVCLSRGTVSITATTKETATYSSVTSQPVELTFTGMPDEIVWSDDADNEFEMSYDDGTLKIQSTIPYNVAEAVSHEPVSYESSNPDVVKVDNNNKIIYALKEGTVTLTAITKGSGKYEPTKAIHTIKVGKRNREIIWNPDNYMNLSTDNVGAGNEINLSSIWRDKSSNLNSHNVQSAEYIVLNDGVAQIVDGKLRLLKAGTTSITITIAADENYNKITETKEIRVRTAGEHCNTLLINTEGQTAVQLSNSKGLKWTRPLSGAPAQISLEWRRKDALISSSRPIYIRLRDKDGNAIYTMTKGFDELSTTFQSITIEEGTQDWSKAVTFEVEMSSFELSSHWVEIRNVVVPQKSYLRVKGAQSIDETAFINTPWEREIVVEYSDVPAISASITNNLGLELRLKDGDHPTNDCGQTGEYVFIVSGQWELGKSVTTDIVTFSTIAGDKVEFPIKLLITSSSPLDFYAIKDNSWTNPENWWSTASQTHGHQPNGSTQVTIHNSVYIDTEVSVFSLGINSEDQTSITIAPQAGLTVYTGGMSLGYGNQMILQSSIEKEAKGQAYFKMSPKAINPATGQPYAMPNATVQFATRSTLETGANKDATWQYMGIPVANLDFKVDYITWLYRWNEQVGWEDYKAISDANGTAPLKAWEGYAITQYGQPIYEFSGKLLNNDQTITLTKTEDGMNGDNLFANSYPAPIDVKRFTEDDFVGNVTRTFYIFNSGSWNQWDDHKEGIVIDGSLNSTTPGQYIGIPVMSAAQLPEATYLTMIAPMQGVYVVAEEGIDTEHPAQIKLNYTKHVWNGYSKTNQMVLPQRAPQFEDDYVDPDYAREMAIQDSVRQVDEAKVRALTHRFNITAYGKNSGADNVCAIECPTYAHTYENGYDAPKIMADADGVLNIYTNEADCGLMAVDATNNVDSMFIGFNAGDDVNYELYITSVIGDDLELMDMQTGDRFALRDSASYEFAATPNSEDPYRFRIFKAEKTPVVPTGWTGLGDKAKIWYNKQTLYISDAAANSTASIYTAAGELLEQVTFNHNTTISTADMPEGIYTVRVEDSVLKFFVKH